MQIQVNEIEPCRMSVQCTIDSDEIQKKEDEVLQVFKKAPVPGCRPNKAPMSSIKMHYRDQIKDSLQRLLLEDSYHQAIFEHSLKTLGTPNFTSAFFDDKKFKCEFEVNTKPEFTLSDYKTLQIPKPHESTTVELATEQMLEELRKRYGNTVPYTDSDFVQLGDSVILDYTGTVDGEKVDSLCAQGEMVTIGSTQLKEFDDQLLGMSMGETRTFKINLPNDSLPSLSNKQAEFSVTLGMGSKTEKMPLDDSLAVKCGKKDMEELRTFVAGSAMAQLQNQTKAQVMQAVCNKLVQDTVMQVPRFMVVSEAQHLANSSKLIFEELNYDDQKKYTEMAENNVKLALILDRIKTEEPEAVLSQEESFSIVKNHIQKSGQNLEETMKSLQKNGTLQMLMNRVSDEYALDFVIKHVTLVE